MIWFLPVTLITISVFALLGFGIIRTLQKALRLPKKPLQESKQLFGTIFFSIIIGLTAVVTFYSCAISGFRTVNIIFFLLAFFYFREVRKSAAAHDNLLSPEGAKTSYRYPLSFAFGLLVALCFVYAAGVYQFVSFGEFPVRAPYTDLVNYSNISQYLNSTGQENFAVAFNLLDTSYHGTEPYHYYESWLNALLYRVLGLPHLQAMMMVTYPVFYLILFIGFLAIWETFGKVNLYALPICFGLLFVAGVIYFSGSQTLFDSSFLFYHRNIFVERKLGPLYMFAAAAILALRYNKFVLAVLFLLCMATASATPFPGVVGGVFLLFLLTKFAHLFPDSRLEKWCRDNRKEVSRAFLYTMAMALAFFIFYYFTKNSGGLNVKRVISVSSIYHDFVSKGLLQRLVAYAKSSVYILFALLPFLLFIYAWLRKNKRVQEWLSEERFSLVLLYGCITFASASAWAFLYFMLDSQQLAFNVLLLLSNLIVCFFLIGIFSRSSVQYKSVWLLAFAVLIGYNMYLTHRIETVFQQKKNYSENYLHSVQNILLNHNLSRVGVCLLADESFQTVYNKNTWFNTLGHYMYLMQNDVSVIGLNDLDLPLSNDKIKRDIEEVNLAFGVFKRFADRQKEAGKFTSAAQSQVDFIRHHKINFMITQQNAVISPELQALIKKSVSDPASGEVFHLLREEM